MLPAEASPARAVARMALLEKHDFAFILRSNGQWTYAIIANREDDFILFVVDTVGDTKVLKKKNWATSIRLVDPKEACCPVKGRLVGGRRPVISGKRDVDEEGTEE